MNENLLNALEKQAKKQYAKNKKISFDEATRLVVANIDWQEGRGFKQELDLVYKEAKVFDRLDYYYDQIIKNVVAEESVDLSAGVYLDFWSHLDSLNLKKYFLKFQSESLNEKNLFMFLSVFKNKIKEAKFVNNFKLKSIQMIEVKKGFSNE